LIGKFLFESLGIIFIFFFDREVPYSEPGSISFLNPVLNQILSSPNPGPNPDQTLDQTISKALVIS
jgi:hypothetical protein